MSIDPRATIRHFAEFIDRCSADTKILAASFKNIGQVTDAFGSGAHCVTLNPDLLHDTLGAAFTGCRGQICQRLALDLRQRQADYRPEGMTASHSSPGARFV